MRLEERILALPDKRLQEGLLWFLERSGKEITLSWPMKNGGCSGCHLPDFLRSQRPCTQRISPPLDSRTRRPRGCRMTKSASESRPVRRCGTSRQGITMNSSGSSVRKRSNRACSPSWCWAAGMTSGMQRAMAQLMAGQGATGKA